MNFGESGTLGGEWRPASEGANDFGCRQRARECQTGHTGYRFAPAEAGGIAAGQKPVHSGLNSYARHSLAELRQLSPDPQ